MGHQLGSLLVGKGWLTFEQLEAALAAQPRRGGRIGTNLIRLGLVSIDQVTEALAEQHGVAPADRGLLAEATSAALGALSRALCEQHKVIPLRIENRTLQLAMLDPQRLDLIDLLGRQVGIPIQPFAMPELCFEPFLARHYAQTARHDRIERSAEVADPMLRLLVDTGVRELALAGAATPTPTPTPSSALLGLSSPGAIHGSRSLPELRSSRPRESDFEIVVNLDGYDTPSPPPSEGAPPSDPAASLPALVQDDARFLPSHLQPFGRYTLICPIASGGMARVYLAQLAGSDDFRKLVAIKRIHDHLSESAEFIQMFVDEARLAARISHPNVVQVIELGRLGGTHFIAMEYVDGGSLLQVLRRARPSPELAAQIVAAAAAGIHAAHELCDSHGELLNVVHRDVSPQNILLGSEGSVKVVDFGVARARGNLHVTGERVIKGKLAYLAPEQVTGEAVDRRADVFALGIVLFEATTRRRLFAGATENETLAAIQAQPIPRPSDLVPDFPRELEQIVMKALSRPAAERFQTARELQEAIEEHLVETRSAPLAGSLAALVQATFATELEERRAMLRDFEDTL